MGNCTFRGNIDWKQWHKTLNSVNGNKDEILSLTYKPSYVLLKVNEKEINMIDFYILIDNEYVELYMCQVKSDILYFKCREVVKINDFGYKFLDEYINKYSGLCFINNFTCKCDNNHNTSYTYSILNNFKCIGCGYAIRNIKLR